MFRRWAVYHGTLLKLRVFFFFQQSMEITLNGQIGLSAADHVAAASKRGNVNASTPVPATTAEIVKRLGRQSRKFIVIHSPVQVS